MAELRRVATPELEAGVLVDGPADGAPVVLVHGWPDDVRTWDRVAAALVADGRRVIVPYVRGCGPSRLRPDAFRGGEIAALARDVLALADALGLERFDLVGHDWGARAGYSVAVLAPQRLRTLTALAVAYGTNVPSQTIDLAQARAYWYQWFLATPRGAATLAAERRAFARELWRTWSPGWRIDEAVFEATAASFDNPDWVEVTLHSYRQRWGFVDGDPALASDRARLEAVPSIEVPTLAMLGEDDGATLAASGRGREALFGGPYRLELVPRCGHFLPRERPEAVVGALRAHLARA